MSKISYMSIFVLQFARNTWFSYGFLISIIKINKWNTVTMINFTCICLVPPTPPKKVLTYMYYIQTDNHGWHEVPFGIELQHYWGSSDITSLEGVDVSLRYFHFLYQWVANLPAGEAVWTCRLLFFYHSFFYIPKMTINDNIISKLSSPTFQQQ